MAIFGSKKPPVEGGYSPIQPAVKEGQEGPAFQDREQRRVQRMYEGQAADALFQAGRHQLETGQGISWRDQKPLKTPEGDKVPQISSGGSSEGKG